MGETDCGYGCLGNGDCVRACTFNSIHIDISTGLPVINDTTCNGCGSCVKACPRKILELRKKAKKDRKIYVACSSCDKGVIARKACKVACIACNKCVKICQFGAITMENNLAYIDTSKCTFCRKCVAECPQNSIIELNFPPRKEKEVAQVEPISA
jgi:heterodisulfide reductase subunit A-like polyferredoxin